VEHTYYYDKLSILDYDECLDMNEFRLYRTDGRYFDNVYAIRLWNGKRDIEWGVLKFNLARGDEQSNTHTNGKRKVWMSLNNETLYTDDFHFLTYIEQRLGLEFHNVTSLDLCLGSGGCVELVIGILYITGEQYVLQLGAVLHQLHNLSLSG